MKQQQMNQIIMNHLMIILQQMKQIITNLQTKMKVQKIMLHQMNKKIKREAACNVSKRL